MTKVINSKKYEDIKIKGKELFWKYGTKRVTVEEICREAGVSKMTYYKFFKNKNELVKVILNEIFEDAFQKFQTLVASDRPFSEKIKKIFLMKYEGTKNISMEFISDIYNHPDPEIIEFMNTLQQNALKIRTDFFKTSQEEGLIRKDIKLEFFLAFSDQIIKMMDDEKLMSLYKKPQDFIMESMNFLFYGIVTGNE